MISFNEFLLLVDEKYYEQSFVWRYGQTIMNVLQKVNPEKYKEIKSSDNDCTYDDGIVKYTLDQLEKEWPND